MRSLRNDFYANLILQWHARRTRERKNRVECTWRINANKLLVFIRSLHLEAFCGKLYVLAFGEHAYFSTCRDLYFLFNFSLIHALFFYLALALSLTFSLTLSLSSSLSHSLSLSLTLHSLARTPVITIGTYTYNSCQHIFLSICQSGVVKEYEQANIW